MGEGEVFCAEHAERAAAIAEDLTRAAVSALRASELAPPETYPAVLAWWPCPFGLLVEADGAQNLLVPDAPIGPKDVLCRLIHPGFSAGIAGAC